MRTQAFPSTERHRRSRGHALLLAATLMLATCGGDPEDPTLVIGGIPDQDFALLEERFGSIADILSAELDVAARYVPASDYATLVTAFEHGDVLLGWFGGLTGVQARRAVPGASAIVQRPSDTEFRSVFVVRSGLEARELGDLAGVGFTFGSESSTSGHLMPRHFLLEAGVDADLDFRAVNYSGSHDATWQLVEGGVWDAGVLNAAVWERAVREGQVDTTAVRVLEISPPYYDYHWVAHPDLELRFGEGTTERITRLFVGLGDDEAERELLARFETDRFIETRDANYDVLEGVAANLGLLGEG